MNYFQVTIKTDDETEIGKLSLLHLPRTGDYLHVTYDHEVSRYLVKEVWHFVGDNKIGHRVNLYVIPATI